MNIWENMEVNTFEYFQKGKLIKELTQISLK